jgi:hypothetical protein
MHHEIAWNKDIIPFKTFNLISNYILRINKWVVYISRNEKFFLINIFFSIIIISRIFKFEYSCWIFFLDWIIMYKEFPGKMIAIITLYNN